MASELRNLNTNSMLVLQLKQSSKSKDLPLTVKTKTLNSKRLTETAESMIKFVSLRVREMRIERDAGAQLTRWRSCPGRPAKKTTEIDGLVLQK